MTLDWASSTVRARYAAQSQWKPGLGQEYSWRRLTDDHLLWCIIAGEGRVLTRSGWKPLRPDRWIWLTPGHFYDADQDPRHPVKMLYVHFDVLEPGTSERPHPTFVPPEVIDLPKGDDLCRRLIERAAELLPVMRSPDPLPPARQKRADALLSAAVVELLATASASPPALLSGTMKHRHDAVVDAMQKVWADPGRVPPVADLAAAAGYSIEHFGRLFRQFSGYTPQGYVVRARIVRAREMLMNTSLSVGAIARRLGYADQQFFSRQFKQHTGFTARQVRSQ